MAREAKWGDMLAMAGKRLSLCWHLRKVADRCAQHVHTLEIYSMQMHHPYSGGKTVIHYYKSNGSVVLAPLTRCDARYSVPKMLQAFAWTPVVLGDTYSDCWSLLVTGSLITEAVRVMRLPNCSLTAGHAMGPILIGESRSGDPANHPHRWG